jgi:3-deoxy-7-phosphoheptulonate synthase
MIVILQPEISSTSETGKKIIEYLEAKPGITPRIHEVFGTQQVLTEIYLVGDTSTLDRSEIESLPGVDSVVKVSRSYAVIGRTRMGAYKPRTSPYAFQGHGKACLPYVFELAGKYGIKVIAMEITHESHVDEIREALEQTGNPTGVMLQIGTRNTQNFELLKFVGRQRSFPVLLKRGFGITLEESLNAAEYLASEGNPARWSSACAA